LWELLITFSLYPEPLFGGALRLALFAVLPAAFVGYIQRAWYKPFSSRMSFCSPVVPSCTWALP